MTDLTEAARATRRYFITRSGTIAIAVDVVQKELTDTQAACDRLNLLAVLEALREPSEGMATAAERVCGLWEGFLAENGWRAMIDKLIAEVRAR